MSRLHSAFSRWRDYLTPASHTSTFTTTGELTPEEFVAAGDYLVYKFPTWSWAAADPAKRVAYLPDDKQYLVLRHAPCHSRLDDTFSSWNPGDDDEEWAGGTAAAAGVQTVGPTGDVEAAADDDSDDEIPDIDDEDDDDEAIIRDSKRAAPGLKAPLRYYNLYLTYSTYFRVPRSYLSGFDGSTQTPLHPPTAMFDDIAPDYREKTVTLEPFPCTDPPTQMASVHPCKHAETMKRIFDGMARRRARRAEAASGAEGAGAGAGAGAGEAAGGVEAEWEEVVAAGEGDESEDDGGLRVDQYLVVFVKFLAGVVPGVEMDYTMGI
ncbi:putative autophagy protein [Geopyxis carbonaria]|nr:putative autophagy protein [Geopyxis carbonaria]